MNQAKLFKNCSYQDGIYVYGQENDVSYPDEGNESCYQVEDKSFWFKHRNKVVLEAMAKFGNPGNFLDIGGGNGFVAKAIQDAGYETVMVEPFHDGCLNACKRGVRHVVQGILDKNTFPKESFDNVGAFDVLEHIENRNDFLRSAHRVLKPKGKMIIAVPAFMALWSQEDISAGHYLRYTKNILHQELTANGFKPNYTTYFFSFLPIPLFLLKAIPYKFRYKEKTRTPSQDHKKTKVLEKLFYFERKNVRTGKSVSFGSSLICVAEK